MLAAAGERPASVDSPAARCGLSRPRRLGRASNDYVRAVRVNLLVGVPRQQSGEDIAPTAAPSLKPSHISKWYSSAHARGSLKPGRRAVEPWAWASRRRGRWLSPPQRMLVAQWELTWVWHSPIGARLLRPGLSATSMRVSTFGFPMPSDGPNPAGRAGPRLAIDPDQVRGRASRIAAPAAGSCDRGRGAAYFLNLGCVVCVALGAAGWHPDSENTEFCD